MRLLFNSAKQLFSFALVFLFLSASTTFAQTFEVSGDSINTRSGPGTSYAKQGKLKRGAKLKELERQGNWSKVITQSGLSVWVHNGYISKLDEQPVVTPNTQKQPKVRQKTQPKAQIMVQVGHSEHYNTFSLNSDASRIASGGRDGTIAIWDTDTTRLLRTWQAHTNYVESIHYLKQSGYIISIGKDEVQREDRKGRNPTEKIKVWDSQSGVLVSEMSDQLQRDDNDFGASSVSDNQTLLSVIFNGKSVIFFNLETLQLAYEFKIPLEPGQSEFDFNLPRMKYVALAPEGDLAALVLDNFNILLVDYKKGKILKKHKYELNKNQRVEFRGLEFSPSGKYLAVIDFFGDVRLYETSTGKHAKTFSLGIENYEVTAGAEGLFAFSPDETKIIISTPKTNDGYNEIATLWDLETATKIGSREGSMLKFVQFTQDGNFIYAIGAADPMEEPEAFVKTNLDLLSVDTKAFGILKMSSTDLRLENIVIRQNDPVLALDLHPTNPETIAVSTPHARAIVWNFQKAQVEAVQPAYTARFSRLNFSPDGNKLATIASNSVTAFQAKPIAFGTLSSGPGEILDRGVSGSTEKVAVFSPDGRTIASGGEEKVLRIWDAETYALMHEVKQTHSIYSISFSNDGSTLAVGRLFGGVSLYDVTDNFKETWRIDETSDKAQRKDVSDRLSSAYSLAFLKDGTGILVGDADGQIWHLNSENGQTIEKFGLDAAILQIGDVAVSPDGKEFVVAGDQGHLVRYSIDERKVPLSFAGHFGTVSGVRYSHDGKLIISTGFDGFTRVWRAADARLLVSLFAKDKDKWGAVTPEGFFDGSEFGVRNIHAVSGDNLVELEQFYDALYRPDLVRHALEGDSGDKVASAGKKLNLDALFKSGLPPQILKISSSEGLTVEVDKVDIIADLQLNSGGLGRVEIRVNGATQLLNNMPLEKNQRLKISQSIFLTPGKNQIKILAYNSANLIASDAKEITLHSTAEPKDQSALHILAVGVNEYEDDAIVQLNYAVNDAKAISKAFQLAGSAVYDNVYVTTLLDREASEENLDRVFTGLGARVRPEDIFVFFLAGHGKTYEGRYYFIPPNFAYKDDTSFADNGIGQAQWQEWFARVPAQKSILLYDTCESGSLVRDNQNDGLEVTAAVNRLTRATGRTIVTAASDTEPALEGYGGHGLFSYLVLEAIGVSDRDKDGQLEVTELTNYVKEQLPEVSYEVFKHRQIPQSSVLGYSFSLGQPRLTLN